jgi:hypothetical protein
MTRLTPLLVIGALSGGLAACGDSEDPTPAAARTTPAPSATPVVAEGELGSPTAVPAQANLFGAGRDEPPAPGDGGAGVPPPFWRLPDGVRRVVTFPRATGRVTPIEGRSAENGAEGDRIGGTDVKSYGGISGIVHDRNGMFLAGVFLADDPPSGPAPPRLDFTSRDRFDSLSPRLAQTFLIGNGKRRSYHVPDGATRLFLGFADGYYYMGPPGWYGNNRGELTVTVDLSRGRPDSGGGS